MNRDQLIQWANAVGFAIHAEEPYVGITPVTDRLERFAALVHDAAMEACMCAVAGAFSDVADYEALANACDAIRALQLGQPVDHLISPVPTFPSTTPPSEQRQPAEWLRCANIGAEIRALEELKPEMGHLTARSDDASKERRSVYARAIVPCVTGCGSPNLCEIKGCMKLQRGSSSAKESGNG